MQTLATRADIDKATGATRTDNNNQGEQSPGRNKGRQSPRLSPLDPQPVRHSRPNCLRVYAHDALKKDSSNGVAIGDSRVSWSHQADPLELTHEEKKEMKKYTVTFQIEKEDHEAVAPVMVEWELKDLLTSSILPAINAQLVPLSFTVKNARN